MKKLSILATTILLSISSPALAADSDDAAACTFYSKIGGTMAEFLLPLKMQDMVNMMSGKNPELLQTMTQGLLSGLDGNDIATMMSLPDGEAEIAGEAAGTVAMQVLMSGQATTPQEVTMYMRQSCESIGFSTIIANQRAASAAAAGNYSQ